MKKYTLILSILISTMAFAQILPGSVTGGVSEDADTMSGEIDVTDVFDSAPEELNMSGEIQINLPYDPSEVEDPILNSAWDYQYPPYTLNSATNVATGPESIMLAMLAIVLGTVIYTYRIKTQKD